ncbi:MAG: hypothetical protein A3J97_10150 [Spirochaetes bacterium RIFOXYC1_FULL_54_7]|nr:MAG: hypothetical protein A3J97_10150 [Spirochaetes bacterium RIFOXYC1_FULL_54_7]
MSIIRVIRKQDTVCEISQVITGKKHGRLSATETTIFDATGLATQDILSAQELRVKAERLDFGTSAAI